MINVAVVGMGRRGRCLVDAVHGKSDRVRVVAGLGCDGAFAAGRGFALRRDLDEVLSDPSVDGIVLATPPERHAEQVQRAARAGRHVYCDRPLALRHSEAIAAVRAAQNAGVVLAVGHACRFLPALRACKRLLDAGELGRLLHAEGDLAAEPHEATHGPHRLGVRRGFVDVGADAVTLSAIDAMVYLCGRISAARGQSYRLVHEARGGDGSSVTLRFASGATGCLVRLATPAPRFRLQLFGTVAAAALNDGSRLELAPLDGTRRTLRYPPLDMERAALEAFADAAAGTAAYPVPHAEVVDAVALLEQIRTLSHVEDAAAGRAVA